MEQNKELHKDLCKELWVATGNKGKLEEIKILLADVQGLVLHSQDELSYYTSPPETGKTFEDNARIKAKSLKAVKPGTWILADDSGLSVEALGGLPGVHSARYAGPHAKDAENTAKLLKMLQLKTATNRKAAFLCCLVVYTPEGKEMVFHGQVNGTISKTPSGLHGFGYDPVFVPEGETKSLAELGLAFKNKHSHRALALLEFLAKLKTISNP